MKIIKKQLKIMIILTISFSCNYSQSSYKNLTTGAEAKGSGLICDDISTEINQEKVNRNVFKQGEEIFFYFNDIKGFTKDNNLVFPDIALSIIKNDNEVVMENESLLPDFEGTDLSPLLLNCSFVADLPFQNNEKYKALVKIWDTKGKGVFTYEFPFTVESNHFLEVQTSENVSYSNVFIWNETQKIRLKNNRINMNDAYILIIENIVGLNNDDTNVYPLLSISLDNKKGHILLDNDNILGQYVDEGIEAKRLEDNEITIDFSFNEGEISNPYYLKTILKDRKTGKQLIVNGILEFDE